jgi:hypothetical protein
MGICEGGAGMRDRTRPIRIMRALACTDEPMSTPQLVSFLGEEGDHDTLLTWYGHVLRRYRDRGLLGSPGWTSDTGWQKPPARLWAITDAGRRWIEQKEQAALRDLVWAQMAAEQAEAITAAVKRQQEDPLVSWAQRREAALSLHALGVSSADIGRIFGVSRSMASLYLAYTDGKTYRERYTRS